MVEADIYNALTFYNLQASFSNIGGSPAGWFAGGGGGSNGTSAGTAGAGNAGNGGLSTTGTAGTTNRGGGGGGGGDANNGASGGSGIVILKFPDTRTPTFSGGVSQTTSAPSGGFKISTITAAGVSDTVSWA
jgi:hypothetical protein